MDQALRTISNSTARYLAVNLIRLRDARQMTIQQAAAALGVAESSWSQWETGARFPSGEMLDLVARLFGVPPCLLFSRATGQNPPAGRAGKVSHKVKKKNSTHQA
jgi:transcriptional regulator with XRE-family HTH domain